MSLVLDEHREYLSDAPRLEAFRRAIHSTIKPGDVVVDLACGTGILGLMACEAGASRVYAIDHGEILEVARAVARANPWHDRITHISAHSTRATLPERADAMVFDQIGHLGFNAGLLQYAEDARRRLLKPGARLVPGAVTLEFALAASNEMRRRVEFWGGRPAGFDFSPALVTARNTGYPVEVPHVSLLSEPIATIVLDPCVWQGEQLDAAFAIAATDSGTVDGLCGWFNAELAPGVWMTNAPRAERRINRRPAFLPFERPLEIARGDRFQVNVRLLPADSILTWDVARADGRDRMRHSTWKGLLPLRETLARTRAGAVPALTESGRARRSVLELCDGRRSVRDIESAMAERHPKLFADAGARELFVAEVLAVYAEV